MVCVISNTGSRLMPTNEYKARKLLNSGKAVIYKYKPFTIKLTQRADGSTQPVEYKCDTGYQNIGVSICSEKHEFVHNEYKLLTDEPERHNDCRKYRRTRRNRLRYRKARWSNRKSILSTDGFAPSIRNKRNIHIKLFEMYSTVIPITSAVFEMGQFDTQLLKAIEEGKPLPEGTDYQHGERYGIATLREAVFSRDNYTCFCCKLSAIKDKAVLHVHHTGFWKGDRTNRLANLATVCEKCHTPKNHKQGGKLYGLEPKLKAFKGATFMTMVRYDMFAKLKAVAPDVEFCMTYGALTKLKRKSLGLKKTHANDAYAMGELHPEHKAKVICYRKLRRNNRILCKFYDAKYIDTRDGSTKSGARLGCNRTNRRELRNSDKNEHIYRGQRISKGRVSVRRQYYSYRPYDKVFVDGTWYTVKGVQNNGTYVALQGFKPVIVSRIQKVKHSGAWGAA